MAVTVTTAAHCDTANTATSARTVPTAPAGAGGGTVYPTDDAYSVDMGRPEQRHGAWETAQAPRTREQQESQRRYSG